MDNKTFFEIGLPEMGAPQASLVESVYQATAKIKFKFAYDTTPLQKYLGDLWEVLTNKLRQDPSEVSETIMKPILVEIVKFMAPVPCNQTQANVFPELIAKLKRKQLASFDAFVISITEEVDELIKTYQKAKLDGLIVKEPTKSYSETVKSHAPNPSKSQTKPASHKSSASSVGSTGQSQAKPEYPECSACGNKHPNSCRWRSNGHPEVNKSSKTWRDSDHGKQYKALQHWHLQRGKRYDEGSKSHVF